MANTIAGRLLFSTMVLLAASAANLGATTINLLPISSATDHIGDGSSTSIAALGAMQRAANTWESILLDNIVINLWVDFEYLAPNVLADSTPSIASASYATEFLPQVAAHLTTTYDPFLANLPSGTVPVNLPAGMSFSGNISLSYANAKALGYTNGFLTTCDLNAPPAPGQSACDGVIRLGRGLPFDFDNTNGVVGYDLEGIAMHEIGHALGFFSDVDTVDFMLHTNQTGPVSMSVLDLYRFANCQISCTTPEPNSLSTFKTATRDMTTADPAVFAAVDPALGLNDRFGMSQGYYTGDGYQASHWKNQVSPIGLMNPTVAANQTMVLTDADKRAMGALGYQLLLVPEPGSLVLMSSGCIAVILIGRRRRAQA